MLIAGIMLICNCSSDDDNSISLCDAKVILDKDRYQEQAQINSELLIIEAVVVGDCLNIKFSSGGCDGSTWVYNLIDSEEIREPIPPERDILLHLEDNEDCEALIQKESSFDLKELRIEGESEIRLYLLGYEDNLNYTY